VGNLTQPALLGSAALLPLLVFEPIHYHTRNKNMKTIATVSLLGLLALSATGCANGPARVQVEELNAEVIRCHQVMAQHETAIKVQDDAAIAYDWTVLNTEAAWNSPTAVAARARLKAYTEELSAKAHTAYTNYTK
jgi:hypothetical protein